MNNIYFRFFYNDIYIDIKANRKVYLSEFISCDKELFIEIKDIKLRSNFFTTSEFNLNKLYYFKEYRLAIKIIKKCIEQCYVTYNKDLALIFDINSSITIENNRINSSIPIYINKVLVNKGSYFYGDSLLLCINTVEIVIKNQMIFVYESHIVNENYCFKFKKTESVVRKHSDDVNLNYNFNYDLQYKTFDESLVRYIIPPVIILVIMGTFTIITKRQSFIFFMVASSISSMISSLLMYFYKQKQVNIYNKFVLDNFNRELTILQTRIVEDTKIYHRKIELNILLQKEPIIGYVRQEVFVENKILEKELKQIFLNRASLYFLKPIFLHSITLVITGNKRMEYITNVILLALKLKTFNYIVFINCNVFPIENHQSFKYINSYTNLSHLNNCLFIVGKCSWFNEDSLSNSSIIYLEYRNDVSMHIDTNKSFKHQLYKYENNICNKPVYAKLALSKMFWYVYYRKLVYNQYNLVEKGRSSLKFGDNFFFDLIKNGPHGIVVGMTGSGKSVFLKTLIMEVCRNYSPNEFIVSIIDFKGASLANSVNHLPHISSILSNLNTNYYSVIKAIEIELEYRQQIFSNLNISEYSDKPENFVLPRILLIIDEMAEVYDRANEIIDKINSIARIGRSLGLFLVISMQNTTRILSEQLLANISYKVCLKVSSTSESTEIISNHDAYYFSSPGEAIIRISNQNQYVKINDYSTMQYSNLTINNVSSEYKTYWNVYSEKLVNKYEKTNYLIWNDFSNDGCGIELNNITYRKIEHYKFVYDNYLIIGKSKSGKTSFAKSLIYMFGGVTMDLGTDNSLISKVDNYCNDPAHLDIYIRYCINLKIRQLIIIDNYEMFSCDILDSFINEVLTDKYKYLKVVVISKEVTVGLNKYVKHFNNKFLFAYDDPHDAYQLFYQKLNFSNYEVGYGICLYNNNLVEFKNHLTDLVDSNKNYCLKNLKGLYYLSDFTPVNLENVLILYDSYLMVNNCDCYYYKNYSEREIEELALKYSVVLTNTSKIKFNYIRINIVDEMLFDLLKNDEVIVIEHVRGS